MIALTAPATWQHEQAGKTETVEDLWRRAIAIFEANRIVVSPSKLSRIIRAHVRHSGDSATAARQLEAYCLSYADPVGETAIANVLAEKR